MNATNKRNKAIYTLADIQDKLEALYAAAFRKHTQLRELAKEAYDECRNDAAQELQRWAIEKSAYIDGIHAVAERFGIDLLGDG